MQKDEQAIRDLVRRWMTASKEGDLETVLSLMADDVIFMVAGREPFGKAEFVAGSKQMKDAHIEGTSDIKEIEVVGDWAWMRTKLDMRVSRPGDEAMEGSGYVLTVLRKEADGRWVIYRDANLLRPVGKG
jgi:uncharacterized protein (TIGR02246 family)